MRLSRFLLPSLAIATLLAGCGGVYQISRAPGNAGSGADFARDERACNQQNFFVMSSADDPKQTIYITDKFIGCMEAKGWKYARSERKFWPAKQSSL